MSRQQIPEDSLDYQALFQEANARFFHLLARDVVRQILERTAAEGLPSGHHFYLTFRTDAPGVGLANDLRDLYPDTMTVVLQHQFWDLEVDDEGFSVTLSFSGAQRRLGVPFDAMISFVDPDAQVVLPLDLEAAAAEAAAAEEAATQGTSRFGRGLADAVDAAGEDSEADAGSVAEVVSIDAFRKR